MIPETTFNQRRQQFNQTEKTAQQRYNQLAFWRLVWFVGSVVGVWILVRVDQQLAAVAGLLIGVVGFLILLKRHQTIRRERDLAHHLTYINQDDSATSEPAVLKQEQSDSHLVIQ